MLDNKGQQSLNDRKQMRWVIWLLQPWEFSGHGTGRENPGEAQQTHWVEKMDNESSEKTRQLEFTRQHAKEREPSQTFSWVLVSTLCKETTPGQGNNHQKGLEGLECCLYPPARWNTSKFKGNWIEHSLSRALPQERGMRSPRVSTALTPPKKIQKHQSVPNYLNCVPGLSSRTVIGVQKHRVPRKVK